MCQRQEDKGLTQNERGFTFLELLLVLSVVAVMTFVILPFSDQRLARASEEDALKTFIAAVHEAQLYAITHYEGIRVYFLNDFKDYLAETSDRTILVSGQFPEGMKLASSSPLKELYFAPSGMMSNTGKMIIQRKQSGNMTISFQFERGRMIISE